MKLAHGLHLAYCTNIHRGESWSQVFSTLQQHTLAVRDRVAHGKPYAIGLRLGAAAAQELAQGDTLKHFKQWLEANHCYVFTINGFPYGTFHGARVKEQVYMPDWTTPERVEYTNLLFDLLGELVPPGVEGSVSTVPVSFKEFNLNERQIRTARENLWRCIEHIEKVSRRTGRTLHLGLEPEPLCFLETTDEAIRFIEQMRADRPGDLRLAEHLGVNYDACHLAIEYEDANQSLNRLKQHGIKISKLHLSAALKVQPLPAAREALKPFVEGVYFHQVIQRNADGKIVRYRDLDVALEKANTEPPPASSEWRIHFHIPLHAAPAAHYGSTADHLLGVLDFLKANPGICHHLEMETYTWEVMPGEMKNRNVVDQLTAEYVWTLDQMKQRGLA